LAKGRSRSQSRGHPKKREKPLSKKTKPPLHDPRIAQAVAKLFRGKSLSESATESGVSPERLRKVVKDYRLSSSISERPDKFYKPYLRQGGKL
jgi:hypothetical protein